MADISKIKLPSGTTYDIKDSVARETKIDKPSTEGTSGQVLSTDGNGGTAWADQPDVITGIHVGETAPTDPNVQVWLQPDGESDVVGIEAEVTQLPAGSSPTAEFDASGDVLTLQLGLPAPEKGDRGDTVIIATKYEDLTFPVAEGTYCLYNNLPYVSKQAIATSEAWTAAHWDQVSFEDEIGELKSALQAMSTATTEDEGKALKAKTVSGGKVTEWEFGEAGGVDPAVIEQAVDDWLDDNPQATTTVQDGSLTESKFTSATLIAMKNDCVTPEMFGAVGDGITDDTQAVSNAIENGKRVVFADKSYKIGTINVDKSVDLVGRDGTKIITGAHTSAMSFAPTLKARLYMAEDYSQTDTEDSGFTKIKLTSTGTAKVGDLVHIYSDQVYVPARSYYVKGCVALITKIDTETDTIYINFAMPFDLLAEGTVIDVYEPLNVKISKIEFRSDLDLTANTGTNGVMITHGAFCDIEDCKFYGFTTELSLTRCVMSSVSGCSFEYAKPSSSLPWDGYGIMVASCNVTTIRNITANCGQHAISTGGTIPVFGTVIRDSRLFAECGEHAIGMHENDHDCVLFDSVVGGIWCSGNCTLENIRITKGKDGGVVLLTGNPGDRKTNALFRNVTFDELTYINLSAYPQNPASAYSNDFGNLIFENCIGGYLRLIDLTENEYVTGSQIDLISVDHWKDCRGFVLNYGVISELSLTSLIFRLVTENGYIVSQVERAINYPCIVLNEHNSDDVYVANQETAKKASAITKNTGTFVTKELDDSSHGRVDNLIVYGRMVDGDPVASPTISFESGNLVPSLDGFSITITNGHLNGQNVQGDLSRWLLIPEEWKRHRMRVSCLIDATDTAQGGNSVAVFLIDANGETIYSTYQNAQAAGTEYTSTCDFAIPDEAYRMVINARLYADAENDSVTASDFSLRLISSLKTNAPSPLYAIPVTDGGNYTDEDNQQWYANYLDFYTGMMVRLVDVFRMNLVREDMLTSMSDYFDSSIVGGFIPANIVQDRQGLARDLSLYYSPTLTILDTDTPPTNSESVWVNDGGIGFAFSASNVGARTMAALATYINGINDKLYCKIVVPVYDNLRQTDVALYREIRTFDGSTTVSVDSGAYISFNYSVDTEKHIRNDAAYRLINTITTVADQKLVYVDSDSDGNPFSLTDAIIEFDTAAGSNSSGGVVYINGANQIPTSAQMQINPCLAVTGLFGTTEQKRVAVIGVKGGRFFGESTYQTYANYYTAYYKQTSRNASGLYKCDSINKISIFSMNEHSFGVGTVIKIYGR